MQSQKQSDLLRLSVWYSEDQDIFMLAIKITSNSYLYSYDGWTYPGSFVEEDTMIQSGWTFVDYL